MLLHHNMLFCYTIFFIIEIKTKFKKVANLCLFLFIGKRLVQEYCTIRMELATI